MMKYCKDIWGALFISKPKTLGYLEGVKLFVNEDQEICINDAKVFSGSQTIIDNIVLCCSNKEMIMTYFEIVCKIFRKYRVSSRLDTCEFLKIRVEYVRHNILPKGNFLAMSKFDTSND